MTALRRRTCFVALACAFLMPVFVTPVSAAPVEPAASEGSSSDTIIVTFDANQARPAEAAADAVAAAVDQVAEATITKVTPITADTVAVQVDTTLTAAEQQAVGAQVERLPGIEAAEPSRKVYAAATDYEGSLWGLKSDYGLDAASAWPIATGKGVVVGVIDTGITAHPDLTGSTTSIVGGNVVAGYDFISDPDTARDGNGWDANPSDTGDYYRNSDGNLVASSWHGTHVSGTIAAISNGSGVVGVAPQARIQPLRVLGWDGGSEADIIAAIRWGAGLSVAGVPDNQTPADVLNLSLGGPGYCSTYMQNAINDAVKAGVAVVVAAGNSSKPIYTVFPANCNNVIRVVATTSDGTRASFSNYGTSSAPATVAAPGVGIYSTVNSGTTTPVAGAYSWMSGTSMATPHVSGVAALLKQLNRNLAPSELRDFLSASATPMASCSALACGGGIVNARRAVDALTPPLYRLGPVTIEGASSIGSTLTATLDLAGLDPAETYNWQWRRNGTSVRNEETTKSSSTYTLTTDDYGAAISVAVTVTAGVESVQRVSQPFQVESGAFAALVSPQVTGSFKVGKRLTAPAESNWTPSATKISYRWLRSGKSISKATKSTYKLTIKDRRKWVSVRVTITRTGYTTLVWQSKSVKVK